MKQSGKVGQRVRGGANRYRQVLFPVLLSAGAAMAAPSVSLPLPPSPLPTAAGRVLVYELNLRNPASATCSRLVDVRAQGGDDASALERRYQGPVLAANTLVYDASMGRVDNTPPVDIPPGGGAVVYFHLTLAQGKPAPTSLQHSLRFTACTDAASGTQGNVVAYEVPVSSTPPVVVGLPFRGDGWVASDSTNPGGTHRRTLIRQRDSQGQVLIGKFHVPERYAIDWVKVDRQARRAQEPLDQNPSYFAYREEVLAVADGVISRTRDGLRDGTPPYPPGGASEETAAGNYVMQDIGGGNYAFYAHLVPGSLRVAEGERVSRGQVIALLGNTGNSTEAHLHFHVSNANDPLFSEGVPYVFDHFESTGQVDGMNEETGLFDDYTRRDGIFRRGLMPGSYEVLDAKAQPAPRRLRGSSPPRPNGTR